MEQTESGRRKIAGSLLQHGQGAIEVAGQKLRRYLKGGGSYLSSGDRRLLFGLGKSLSVDRLTVTWPWGQEQPVEVSAVDRYVRVEPVAKK